ncbi:MAG: transcription-repair coupling factor [Bacilli bacterium]|nr:transcription-repair coupling factor [Bacilli bacterium]
MDDTLGVSLLLATYYQEKKENILVLASNLYNAQRIANLLSSLVGDEKVILFPADELLRAENLATSKELVSHRLYALNEIIHAKNKIVVAHPASVLRYLPSPELFKDLTIKLEVGTEINVDELINKLLRSGYYRVNKIDHSLEFAKRGDIIDIYSINHDQPIRLSLFDNEIESIAYFDIATQESTKKINEVEIVPASDILFSSSEFSFIKRKLTLQAEDDKDNLSNEQYESLKNKTNEDIERLLNYESSDNLYKYYGYLQDKHYSLFDYFDADLVIYSNDEQFRTSSDLLRKESVDYLDELKDDGKVISHLELFQKIELLTQHKKIIHTKKYKENNNDIVFTVRPIITDSSNNALSTILTYLKNNQKVIIALANISQKKNIEAILNENKIDFEEINGLDIPTKDVGISIYSLNEGFELYQEKIAVLTARELFNFKTQSSRFTAKFKEGAILHSYEDLKPGDYVVHEYNGIGKFIDIETLEVDGVHRDFLHLEYANEDKLYVPLNQFRLVRKYAGREGVTPKLSSLNSKTWDKTKEKIKARLNELTQRLSSLYKERASIPGFAFPEDDELQEKFNNEFVHRLTDDQEEAYREIRDDMEKPYPMDRLLCGDVGFGKTEVAFRAIFKCINAGKQAALLCPTTLLCRQHYELAKVRFASFGIKIAVFSRLIPLHEQRQYIKEIKEGKTHLIIGTHRLLSKDITFNNLGLLVVDEEQRFGVEQKERIKEIKHDVDVLSLSATPIPRTLQMSLVGVRSLSQINTAPRMRNPIQTYVTPYSEPVVKELIERELSRDGQIFYVHNNVYSIHAVAARLSTMVPLARIGVVHGQMSREEIEDVMLRFYAGDINLLVATSIIENGIDVPNANMIIVENADMFGLAQLYQIKGRVGRSDRIAYAYLFYNPSKTMNNEAMKRLRAIQEFAELGSGYKIAQRDLMIRGAGDMLGREQAGFIDSVGIDLYVKLLNEAVSKHKNEIIVEHKPNKLLSLDAYIPNDYIVKSEKVEVYQEIENAEDIKTVNKIKKKLKDIYGRIPLEVNNLLIKKKVDLITASEEFRNIREFDNRIVIFLSDSFCSKSGIAIKLFDALYPFMDKLKISYLKKELRLELKKNELWLNDLEKISDKIHKLYLEER